MKNLLCLTLTLITLSACSIVGTAIDIVTIPVDLLTMDERSSENKTKQLAIVESE